MNILSISALSVSEVANTVSVLTLLLWIHNSTNKLSASFTSAYRLLADLCSIWVYSFVFVFYSELLSNLLFIFSLHNINNIVNFNKNSKCCKTAVFYSLVSQLPLTCCDRSESHEMLLAPLCPSRLCPETLTLDFSPK